MSVCAAAPSPCLPSIRRSGDPAIRRSGDPAIRRSGDPAIRRSGDPAIRRSGDTTIRRYDDTTIRRYDDTTANGPNWPIFRVRTRDPAVRRPKCIIYDTKNCSKSRILQIIDYKAIAYKSLIVNTLQLRNAPKVPKNAVFYSSIRRKT